MRDRNIFTSGLTVTGAAFAALIVAYAAPASAQIATYFGADDGAPVTGPYVNSSLAQIAFLAAANSFGSVSTADFESVPTGDYVGSNFSAGPGLTVGLSGPDYGQYFSGVYNGTPNANFANLYAFNTTPGGANYLASAGDTITLTFAGGTNSVGLFLTGLQTVFTSAVTFSFNDGTPESLNLNSINVNGGTEYFGFTDSTKIYTLTIVDTSGQNGLDAWGVDDISYNLGGTPVPEPASLALLGAGVLGLTVLRRRRQA